VGLAPDRARCSKFGLVTTSPELEANPRKEAELAGFLASARPLVHAEPETVAWFAVQFDSPTSGILDAVTAYGLIDGIC
jgi:hypothetical protein